MRNLSLVFLACTVLLTGCSGSDVSRVKDSRMKGWPEFTVGQLLDKRKACSNTAWTSFTDTRDRRVVEYTCENQIAAGFLKAVYEDSVNERRKNQQLILAQAKDQLANAERDIGEGQAEYEKRRDRLSELQRGGSDASEAIRADFHRIQQVTEEGCARVDSGQFMVAKVMEISEHMSKKCKEAVQRAERCPDAMQHANRGRWLLCLSQARLYTGTSRSAISEAIDQVREMAEKAARDQAHQLQVAQELLAAAERRVQNNSERLEKARLAAEAAPDHHAVKQQEGFINDLNRTWTHFKTVKETTQWAIQEGHPVYLGSRIDLVFSDRTVDMPLDAQFVFEHAARNAESIDDLLGVYRVQVRNMWNSYEPPKP